MTVHQLAAGTDALGESPFWSPEEGALYWVDMLGRRIRRLDWATGRNDSWPAPDFPTALALRSSGGAIVALNRAVSLFDFEGQFRPWCVPEPGRDEQRLNEGRCDPSGRFWVGSMMTNLTVDGQVVPMRGRAGQLYCVDAKGSVRRTTDDVFGIPNTMIWTPHGTFLIADSMSGEIYAYDYIAETAQIVNRRLFSKTPAPGVPDGSALDTEGCVWNARFGGQCVVRFSPGGEIDRIIQLPALNPTSCTFGGPDRDVLFVTTATAGLTAAQRAKLPGQGALFAIETGVQGVPATFFAG